MTVLLAYWATFAVAALHAVPAWWWLVGCGCLLAGAGFRAGKERRR